jgi:hypothetical protein
MDNTYIKIRGIVNQLNSKLDETGIKDLRIYHDYNDKTKKTKETHVYFCAVEYSGLSNSGNKIGFRITDENNELLDPHGIERSFERMIEGAKFALQIYGFDVNLERFKRLAEKMNFILRQFQIDDRPRIEEYLWNNLDRLNLIASIKYEAQKLLGIDAEIEMSLVPVYQPADEIKEMLTFNFNPVIEKYGSEPVKNFFDEWWKNNGEIPRSFAFVSNF